MGEAARKKIVVAVAVCGAACLAGTPPRASSFDYRVQESNQDLTVAAEIVPPNQVKNLFSTDLSKYVVVEVAIYPKNESKVDVSPVDFMLKLGSGDVVRAANPAAIARVRQQASAPKPASGSDIVVYPTATVGYESGPYHRGPVYGGGVAVGVGAPSYPPPPASTDQDRKTMQLELEEKGLSQGVTTKPVAGYLYFPVASGKQKSVTYDLEYNSAGGKLRLIVK